METSVAPVSVPPTVPIHPSQRREHYMSKCVLGLSITQISIGVLSILLQIVLFAIPSTIHFVGQGIWAGFFFVLTGSFGIVSSKKKTTSWIVTFLTLAIISAVLTVGILTASSIDIIFCEFHETTSRTDAALAINAVMLILAVAEAIVAILSSGLGCHGLCDTNKNQPVVVAGQVQYIQGPDGQQQMVIIPLDQQASGSATGPRPYADHTQPPPYDKDSPPPQYEHDTKVPIP